MARPRQLPYDELPAIRDCVSLALVVGEVIECASELTAIRQRRGCSPPASARRALAVSRATASAERLPALPPLTKAPPAPD